MEENSLFLLNVLYLQLILNRVNDLFKIKNVTNIYVYSLNFSNLRLENNNLIILILNNLNETMFILI